MAKYLILLPLLLIPGISNAQYCTYGLTTAGYLTNLQCYGITNAQALQQDWCPYRPQDPICAPYEQPTCQTTTQTQMQACPSGQSGQIIQSSTSSCPNPRGNPIPGPWITTANTCQTIWQTQTQTLACPVNYSGSITQTRQTTTSGQSTSWQTVSNTCVPNPPTCQVQTQTQSLSCGSGYTGLITQTRTSVCSDPYGQPTWLPWVTSSNTCQKSMTNPTNPTSPVSPLSPTSTPTSSPTTAATQSTSQSTTQTQMIQSSQLDSGGAAPTAASPASSAQGSVTATPTQTTPKGKVSVGGLGLAPSLSVLQKPGLKQYNPYPVESIGQTIPLEILIHDQTLMDLLSLPSITQEPLKEKLDLTQ